jgi:hypothetical protein
MVGASADIAVVAKEDLEGFLIAIGREATWFCAAENASRKSSGHLPCFRLMRSALCAIPLPRPPPLTSSSDSSTTRDKSTGIVSLGFLSRERTGLSRLPRLRWLSTIPPLVLGL